MLKSEKQMIKDYGSIKFSPKSFALTIENLAIDNGLSHMDAVLFYCEQTGLEPFEIAGLIKQNKALKSKIESNARELNFLPKTAVLPI